MQPPLIAYYYICLLYNFSRICEKFVIDDKCILIEHKQLLQLTIQNYNEILLMNSAITNCIVHIYEFVFNYCLFKSNQCCSGNYLCYLPLFHYRDIIAVWTNNWLLLVNYNLLFTSLFEQSNIPNIQLLHNRAAMVGFSIAHTKLWA